MENKDTSYCPISGSAATQKSPLMWHYTCHQCHRHFDMAVPTGPTEEKNRTCPNCGSKDIEHVGDSDNKPCPPGG